MGFLCCLELSGSTSGDGSPRRENGEASSSSGPPAPAAQEEESIFDITSPVSSFLKKSKKQMEKYLKGVLSSSKQQSGSYEIHTMNECQSKQHFPFMKVVG